MEGTKVLANNAALAVSSIGEDNECKCNFCSVSDYFLEYTIDFLLCYKILSHA